jgi:hypothetical protein
LVNEALRFNEHFNSLSDNDQFLFLSNNENVASLVTKTGTNIILRRNSILYHQLHEIHLQQVNYS